MKSLSSKTYQCGVTIQGLTTLSGTVYLTGITNTASWDHVIVGTTAQGQLYTRTYAQLMSDITSGIGLSGYVPTSRTLTINGVSYDLTANRSWTITTPYVSKLQHQVKAGVAINKGQAVYVTSADGTNMIVGLASNASEATSSKTMGLLDATVSTNGFANVVTEGLLAGLDTSTAGAAGDPVWLGTGGNLIYGLGSKPYAPAHLVFIGIVTRKNSNNGEIFVKVQNGFELKEIHDVDLITSAPTAGQLLRYNSDGLWKNWSPNYLTAEADTLATVTGRGATTNTSITVGPDLIVQADGSVNYTASRLWLNSHNNYRGAGVHMSGVGSTWFAGTPYTDFDGGYVIARTGTSNDVSSAQYSNALLTVKSSGNVGIGTASPGAKLHVGGGEIRVDAGQAITLDAANTMYLVGASNQLRLYNGGNPVVNITTGGNVGIGTTTPTYKLSVLTTGTLGFSLTTYNSTVGNPQIDLYDATRAQETVISSTDGTTVGTYLASFTNHPLLFGTYAASTPTARMAILPSGNVGIGTSSPAQKLDVAGGDIILSSNATYIRSKDASGNTPRMFGINPSNDTYIGPIDSYAGGAVFYGVSANVASQTFYTGATARLHITSGGNVGIGTVSPSIIGTGIISLDIQGSSAGGLAFGPSGIKNYIYGASTMYIEANTTAVFATSGTEKMRLTTGGQLIVGGTTVGYAGTKLQVGNTSDSQNGLNILTSTTGYGYILFGDGAGADTYVGQIWYYHADNYMGFQTNGSEKLRITSNGNVGIGTTSPDTPLVVQGGSAGTGGWNRTATLSATYPGLIFNSNGTKWGGMAYDYSAAMRFWVNASNNDIFAGTLAMSILNNGNVGIGTSDPGAKLHVIGNAWINRPSNKVDNASCTELPSRVEFNNAFTAGSSGYTVFTYPTASVFRIYGDYDGNIGGLQPDLQLGLGYLTVKNSGGTIGNIGIGTTAPTHRLTVAGGNVLMFPSDNTRQLSFFSDSYGITASSGLELITGDYIRFRQGSTELARLTTTGLGIGTTSPSSALEVIGTIRNKNASANSNYSQLSTTEATLTLSTYSINTASYPANIIFSPASTEAMRINTAGKVSIGTTDTNSDKSDFTVYTGAGATIALTYDQVRMGGTDVNWGVAIRQSGSFETYGQALILGTSNGNYPINVIPNGTTSAQFYTDYTYFPGLDFAISRVNSTHGAGNFFRGDGSHLVIGTGGTLYLNYANTSGSTYIFGTTYVNNEQVATRAWVGAQGYLTSVSDIWVNTTGDTMTGTLSFAQPVGLGFANGQYIKDNNSGGLIIYSGAAVNITGTSIAVTGAATFSSSVTIGSRLALQPSNFGYASSYKTLLIGSTGTDYTTNAVSLAFNVDVSGNPSGAFNGSGQEYIWRNAGVFITPNAANTTYNTLFSWNSSGQLTFPAALTVDTDILTRTKLQISNGRLFELIGSSTALNIYDASAGASRIYITSVGKVGIGTTAPAEEFHVLGRAIFDGGSGNSSTDAVVYITKSTNDDWGLYVNASALDYAMYARVSPSAGYALAIHNGTTWTTRITGNAIIYLGEKNAIEGNYDTWLRLNNSLHYASGVYTPGVMRADGGFQVSGSTVWHAGNDGSGSGLDADTVDGVQADNIVYGNARGTNQSITNNNNDLDKTGYYTADGFTTKPSGVANWMYIEHIKLYNDNTQYQKQIGYDTYDDRMWVRTKSANTWSSWKQIWTSDVFANNSSNWNTAYGWGNHASAGYLTSVTAHTQAWSTITSTPTTISGYGITNAYTDAQIQNFFNGANAISGYNKSNWDTAYSWGNHASAGYLRLNTWEGNSYIGTSGAHYGTVFYDSNDTSYYVDPSSTSNLSNVSVVGYQYIGGQTSNGQSNYQWDGADYRNPGDWTARLILRKDNATTGINGSIPSLVIFNNNGANQTTASMVFATNECVTGSNSVNLAGIIAKKESVGNCGGWSAGSLNFFVKNFGARVDSLALTSDGNATFSGIVYSTGYGNSSQWNTAYGWGNHASYSYATTSYVTTQINNLINGAPGALDTLDELAAALGDDANFATTVTNSIAGKVSKAGDTMTGALTIQNGVSATWDYMTLAHLGAHARINLGNAENGFLIAHEGTTTATFATNGNLTITGALIETSSIKVKENVKTSEGNLEKVVNLRPVTYNKIGSQTKELGLIAEEVATVYPEFVQYDESGEPIGVNYSRLTAALIGAVKELTNQVQELNKKING